MIVLNRKIEFGKQNKKNGLIIEAKRKGKKSSERWKE